METPISLDKDYYIYNNGVYLTREEIEEKEAEDYAGLDDNMTDFLADLEIEEISGLELLKRIGDDDLCLMW